MKTTRRLTDLVMAAVVLGGFLLFRINWLAGHEVESKLSQRREVSMPIGDFTLTDQNGNPLRFNSLRGKVVVAAFAYTTCPDVCPLITAALRGVQSDLTDLERHRVQLLTVTTDPETDSPKVLAAYAKRYGADLGNWSFLTGDEKTLKKVWQNFGVGVRRKARGLVDHTPLTAIVDQHGTVRFAYVGPAPESKLLLRDLRALLVGR